MLSQKKSLTNQRTKTLNVYLVLLFYEMICNKLVDVALLNGCIHDCKTWRQTIWVVSTIHGICNNMEKYSADSSSSKIIMFSIKITLKSNFSSKKNIFFSPFSSSFCFRLYIFCLVPLRMTAAIAHHIIYIIHCTFSLYSLHT